MSQANVGHNLGRNDPCWCGSGQKYKKCHLPSDLARGNVRTLAAGSAVPVALTGAKAIATPSAGSAIQRTLRAALEHHQASRLTDAERLYRDVLRQDPRNTDALNLLGVVVSQGGRKEEAIDLMRRAIALRPNFPGAYSNLGQALKELDRLDEAETALRRAIALQRDLAEAHHNLGNVMLARQRNQEAADCYRAAVKHRPGYAQAWYNLGQAMRALEQKEEAIACYRTAINLQPSYAPPCNNLGLLLHEMGRTDEAVTFARRAVAGQPDDAESQNNLGVILQAQGNLEEAAEHYRRAVSLRKPYAEAWSNLGGVARMRGELHEAVECCGKAIELAPESPDPYHNLGIALSDLGDHDRALASFDRALEIKPTSSLFHWSRALALLLGGDFAQGWEEYEWRWRCAELKPSRPLFAEPEWDGSDPSGKTILLYAEQGLGDSIQFVRYASEVAARGARVVVGCHALLRSLLTKVEGVSDTWADGEPRPPIDAQLPLLSLPRVLGTRLDTIPARISYLRAEPLRVQHWKERLATTSGRRKVGLVWAGNRQHQNDRNRSTTLASFGRLAEATDTTFVSLQKGEPAVEAARPPAGMTLLDWGAELNDFSDTAALLEALDLVITVDTSVAHLAGALGRPVWTLLPFSPDWRWLLNRDDSPWYPTMRLFRQPGVGDWPTVMSRVADALRAT